MSVTPCYARQLADDRHLHHVLQTCQKRCLETEESLIVSVTQPLPLVEPLAILQRFTVANERHFYWENQQENSTIAAWESCQEKSIQIGYSFQEIQEFIDSFKEKIIEIGESTLPEIGLKFLSHFTFFDAPDCQSPFPSVTIFIPKWQVSRSQERCFLTYNCVLSGNSDLLAIKKEIRHKIQEIENLSNYIVTFPFPQFEQGSKSFQKSEFRQQNQFKKSVNLALNDIDNQELTKIVLAHYLDVISPVPFSPFLSLNYLRQKHPGCYIFSVGNSKGTTFLGATPERLFSLRKQKLVSDALAGSAPRNKSAIADEKLGKELLNNEKERREHQAVSNYLIKQLEQLGLTPQRSRQQLLKLRNIQHLWTLIQADVPADLNPLEIVAKLHPTPAVAGVPTAIACEKIRQYETFDRALYAAPIGWLDCQGNAEFMVGIRSAMINQNQARLYAGAGIVAGSNPDKELAEVQLKLQAMLKALR
jgi:menaquinone-specific isochorismate synthase